METFDVIMVGPKGVGKTSCLASMTSHLKTVIADLGYHSVIPDEFGQRLQTLKDVFTDPNNTFEVNHPGLKGTDKIEPYSVKLCPQGTSSAEITVNFIDVQGGCYSTQGKEQSPKDRTEASEILKRAIVSFWCIDTVAMLESLGSKHKERNDPEAITGFYEDCPLRSGHRIVFVLTLAETYINDRNKGKEWLFKEFDTKYEDVIAQLKKRWGTSIELYVTYIETLGGVKYRSLNAQNQAVFNRIGKYEPTNCDVPVLLALEKILEDVRFDCKRKCKNWKANFLSLPIVWFWRKYFTKKDPMEYYDAKEMNQRINDSRLTGVIESALNDSKMKQTFKKINKIDPL